MISSPGATTMTITSALWPHPSQARQAVRIASQPHQARNPLGKEKQDKTGRALMIPEAAHIIHNPWWPFLASLSMAAPPMHPGPCDRRAEHTIFAGMNGLDLGSTWLDLVDGAKSFRSLFLTASRCDSCEKRQNASLGSLDSRNGHGDKTRMDFMPCTRARSTRVPFYTVRAWFRHRIVCMYTVLECLDEKSI